MNLLDSFMRCCIEDFMPLKPVDTTLLLALIDSMSFNNIVPKVTVQLGTVAFDLCDTASITSPHTTLVTNGMTSYYLNHCLHIGNYGSNIKISNPDSYKDCDDASLITRGEVVLGCNLLRNSGLS